MGGARCLKSGIDLDNANGKPCCNVLLQKVSDLPLEMLETVLMRTYMMFYVTGFERDDDDPAVIFCRSNSAGRQAFTRLCSVCWSWHQTLTGWTESPTPHWVRHQLKKLIEREYTNLMSALLRDWITWTIFLDDKKVILATTTSTKCQCAAE